MSSADIEGKITEVFRAVFQEPSLNITREMTAADVARWDSLTHVEMIAAIEKAFGIKFKLKDVMKMKNVGDLIDTVATLTAA